MPKVPTTPFRDQGVNLQALPREEADPATALLCPVLAFHVYVDRTQSFRRTAEGKGCLQTETCPLESGGYSFGLPWPLGVRAHSTRGMASSWALERCASIADICRDAGWATPNTFAIFYNLCVEPVSSHVLASDGQ